MDKLDIKILELLQQNAKITIKEMASKMEMTSTPIYSRIKHMERTGIIDKYVTLIDPKKCGKSQVVFCNVSMINSEIENYKKFEKIIQSMPEIIECYYLAGKVDYQLKVMVKDIEHYDSFLKRIAAIDIIKLHSSRIVLHSVKYSTVVPIG
ncbi:Lrp/AsnC family transcriptional regulator [Reichenbachiella sp. MALMAid0571]|uniref:Lrp/AsnC family transcriptional regulator n=1 Tax=Reichenbachiella sp. MALMAid0571 TaxID=3143939 RepID=UPI0032DE8D25